MDKHLGNSSRVEALFKCNDIEIVAIVQGIWWRVTIENGWSESIKMLRPVHGKCKTPVKKTHGKNKNMEACKLGISTPFSCHMTGTRADDKQTDTQQTDRR